MEGETKSTPNYFLLCWGFWLIFNILRKAQVEAVLNKRLLLSTSYSRERGGERDRGRREREREEEREKCIIFAFKAQKQKQRRKALSAVTHIQIKYPLLNPPTYVTANTNSVFS